jgi:hypothetical protein
MKSPVDRGSVFHAVILQLTFCEAQVVAFTTVTFCLKTTVCGKINPRRFFTATVFSARQGVVFGKRQLMRSWLVENSVAMQVNVLGERRGPPRPFSTRWLDSIMRFV